MQAPGDRGADPNRVPPQEFRCGHSSSRAPLEDLAAEQLVATMRQHLPDDVALVELMQEHGARALAPLLGCSRAGVQYRCNAAVARLRRLG